MILETKVEREYHDNGNLSYQATRGILSKHTAHLYPERRLHPEGYEWIYCGLCGKWDKNGKQMWVLMYNLQGELMKEDRHRNQTASQISLF